MQDPMLHTNTATTQIAVAHFSAYNMSSSSRLRPSLKLRAGGCTNNGLRRWKPVLPNRNLLWFVDICGWLQESHIGYGKRWVWGVFHAFCSHFWLAYVRLWLSTSQELASTTFCRSVGCNVHHTQRSGAIEISFDHIAHWWFPRNIGHWIAHHFGMLTVSNSEKYPWFNQQNPPVIFEPQPLVGLFLSNLLDGPWSKDRTASAGSGCDAHDPFHVDRGECQNSSQRWWRHSSDLRAPQKIPEKKKRSAHDCHDCHDQY